MRPAPVETDCTFYSTTTTATTSVDCGGCELAMQGQGVGLPCQARTTLPGTATATSTVCSTPPLNLAAASTNGTNATTSGPTCTQFVRPTLQPLFQKTCTRYGTYTTEAEGIECGGCAIATLPAGPGPAVQCETWASEATGTRTVQTCLP